MNCTELMDPQNSKEEEVYCICRSSNITEFMIQCDICAAWYHGECVRITAKESDDIDIYCCIACKKKNPALRTTYKLNSSKNTKKCSAGKAVKGPRTYSVMDKEEPKENTDASIQINPRTESSECLKSKCAATSTSVFQFVDTTIRKAKTDAYEKFKSSTEVPVRIEKPKKKSKSKKVQLKQCYGPGCTNSSRENSKYCSDACGLLLAQHRILEILPMRLKQRLSTPPIADEISRKKLNAVRAQLCDIEKKMEAVDIEIIHLIDKIHQCKKPRNVFVDLTSEDTSTASVDCVLCGTEVSLRTIERHHEQCYKKLDSKIYITEKTERPNDARWNVFCNRKISKNLYCKKMRVLCPQHYKDPRKADEVCGYKLGEFDGVVKYCGNRNRTCKHVNWEEWERAELDLKKLTLLVKYNNLMKEKAEIRRNMSSRGDLLGLMLHETIAH